MWCLWSTHNSRTTARHNMPDYYYVFAVRTTCCENTHFGRTIEIDCECAQGHSCRMLMSSLMKEYITKTSKHNILTAISEIVRTNVRQNISCVSYIHVSKYILWCVPFPPRPIQYRSAEMDNAITISKSNKFMCLCAWSHHTYRSVSWKRIVYIVRDTQDVISHVIDVSVSVAITIIRTRTHTHIDNRLYCISHPG